MRKGTCETMRASEANVKNAVFHYLTVKENMGQLMWWPTNNTGVWNEKKQCFMHNKWRKKGVPDAMVMKNRVFYGVELKSKTGNARKEQFAFKAQLERHGGVYLIIRSVEDIEKAGL
jgi:hypothetical protein